MQVQAIILECMLFLEEMFDNKRPQNNGNGEELIKMNATTHDAGYRNKWFQWTSLDIRIMIWPIIHSCATPWVTQYWRGCQHLQALSNMEVLDQHDICMNGSLVWTAMVSA